MFAQFPTFSLRKLLSEEIGSWKKILTWNNLALGTTFFTSEGNYQKERIVWEGILVCFFWQIVGWDKSQPTPHVPSGFWAEGLPGNNLVNSVRLSRLVRVYNWWSEQSAVNHLHPHWSNLFALSVERAIAVVHTMLTRWGQNLLRVAKLKYTGISE